MKISFEHDYQKKVMTMTFVEPFFVQSKADVLRWRSLWLQELKSWHSPYSVLVDCSRLRVADSPEVASELEIMLRFFKGFFLKKAVGFGINQVDGAGRLPFEILPDEEAAAASVGLRRQAGPREKIEFRDLIQLQNHFQQHVVELSFSEPVEVNSKDMLQVLKSKLTNNLMQWHSKWSLIVDCTNLKITENLQDDFALVERYFRGFFLKSIVGYGANPAQQWFPFQVYRARHKAAAALENEGAFSGDAADCRSRKASP